MDNDLMARRLRPPSEPTRQHDVHPVPDQQDDSPWSPPAMESHAANGAAAPASAAAPWAAAAPWDPAAPWGPATREEVPWDRPAEEPAIEADPDFVDEPAWSPPPTDNGLWQSQSPAFQAPENGLWQPPAAVEQAAAAPEPPAPEPESPPSPPSQASASPMPEPPKMAAHEPPAILAPPPVSMPEQPAESQHPAHADVPWDRPADYEWPQPEFVDDRTPDMFESAAVARRETESHDPDDALAPVVDDVARGARAAWPAWNGHDGQDAAHAAEQQIETPGGAAELAGIDAAAGPVAPSDSPDAATAPSSFHDRMGPTPPADLFADPPPPADNDDDRQPTDANLGGHTTVTSSSAPGGPANVVVRIEVAVVDEGKLHGAPQHAVHVRPVFPDAPQVERPAEPVAAPEPPAVADPFASPPDWDYFGAGSQRDMPRSPTFDPRALPEQVAAPLDRPAPTPAAEWEAPAPWQARAPWEVPQSVSPPATQPAPWIEPARPAQAPPAEQFLPWAAPSNDPLASLPAAPPFHARTAPAPAPYMPPPPAMPASPTPQALAAAPQQPAVAAPQSDLWFLSTEPQAEAELEPDEGGEPSSLVTGGLTIGMAIVVIVLVLVFIQLMTSLFR